MRGAPDGPPREAAWRRGVRAGVLRDGLRALWALIYWNARKSAYVLRGRKGGAPCQHQYDVGNGARPQCEAVWHWDGPGRFQRVCPALKWMPEGWRCSVTAAQVKPFWGRAFAVYAALGLAVYLGLAGGLWLVWQSAGYRQIALADVAWPGRWERVKPAQAEHFRAQGRTALARGDSAAALLALSTAERFRRGGYEERMLLARLWAQAGNAAFADRYFQEVQAEFPGRATETAITWHDQLLATGQLWALSELCLARVAAAGAGARESVWEFSLLFALDHGRRAPTEWARWATLFEGDGERAIPARVRGLLEALALWQGGAREEAVQRLVALRFASDEPLAMRCQVEWLARWGRADEAGVALNRYAGSLGAFEAAALRYHLDVVSGDRDAARANFVGMLREGPLSVTQADRLCALVIAGRDAASLRRTPGFFALEPVRSDAAAQAAFWVAALASKAPAALVAGARERYELASRGETLPVIDELNFRKQNPTDRQSPLFVASFVPLPRETIYALIAAGAEAGR